MKSFVINLYLTETEEMEIQTKFGTGKQSELPKNSVFVYKSLIIQNTLKVRNLFIREGWEKI